MSLVRACSIAFTLSQRFGASRYSVTVTNSSALKPSQAMTIFGITLATVERAGASTQNF
jgi:hypothetical protein